MPRSNRSDLLHQLLLLIPLLLLDHCPRRHLSDPLVLLRRSDPNHRLFRLILLDLLPRFLLSGHCHPLILLILSDL